MVIAKVIIPAQTIASIVTTYLTGPTNVRTLIKKLTVTNPGATAVNVTIYLVPAAGVAGVDNMIVDQKTVAAHETKEMFELENHVVEMDQRLQAFASSANVLVIRGSGVELT